MGPGRLTGMNGLLVGCAAAMTGAASMGPGRLTGMNGCPLPPPPPLSVSLQWGPVD